MNLKINLNIIEPYIDDDFNTHLQIEEQNIENDTPPYTEEEIKQRENMALTMYLINIQYQQTLANLYRYLEQLQNIEDDSLLQLRYSIEHVIQYFLDLQKDLQTHASIFL
jgi:hypothetical protein